MAETHTRMHAAWERRRGSSAEEREGSEREASWEGGREGRTKQGKEKLFGVQERRLWSAGV